MRKKLLIFAAIAFVLFGALWTYVRSDDFSRRIRPAVAGPLEKALGPGARVGLVKANLFPLYLEIRDIAIPSRMSSSAIAIRRVRIYLNPFPLIYRNVSLSSLMVQEPIIESHRAKDGTLDLQEIADRVRANLAADKKSGTSSASTTINIGSVTVRNAIVRLHDAGSDGKATLSRLNFKSSLGGEGSFSLRVTSGALTLSVPAYPELAMDLRATAIMRKGNLDIASLELSSSTARFAAKGTLNLEKGDLRVKGTAAVGPRKLLSGLFRKKNQKYQERLDAEWSVTGTTNDPVVEGSLRCADILMGDVLVRKGALRISYRERTGTITGKGWDLSRDSRTFEVRELSARLGIGRKGIDIIDAALIFPDASAQISGRIDGSKGYLLAFAVKSAGPGKTLSALSGVELDGPVSVRGTLTGGFSAPELDGTIIAGPVNVRGVLFQNLSGMLRLRNNRLSLEGLSVRQDDSRYLLDGTADFSAPEPRYQARLNVIQSDVVGIVALFYKRIPLELSAVGEILFEGTRKEFTGHGRLELASGVVYGEPFDRGTLIVDLNSSRVTFTELTLLKKDGSVTGTGWIGFDGTYTARMMSAGVDLSEVKHLDGLRLAGSFSLDIRSGGSFSLPTVHAEAISDAFLLRDAYLGKTVCTVDLADKTMTVTAGVTGESGSQVSVQGVMQLKQQYSWSLRTMIDAADVSPGDVVDNSERWEKLLLSARGRGDIRGEGGRLESINGNLFFSRIELNQGDYRISNEGDVILRMENGRIIVRSLRLAGTGTKLTVSGSTLPGKDIDLLFTGDANLSLFRLFYREVEHADGTAGLTVRIREDWGSPDVTGELTINDGQIKIRDVPQKFTALNGSLSFDRSGIVSEGFSGEVGGGAIAVSGSAQVDGATLQDFTVKAVIQGVTVRYPQGLTAVLGGTLFLEGDQASRMLSGEMILNRARYEKRVDWKSMLVDVRKGFTPKKKADIGWIGETQLNIRFSGKESIIFESNLAKIPIEVDMLFRGTVNQPQVLGRIEARKGEVYFRKNVFRILYASADFADPNRINPLLDVQAETRVREYQIRLSVSGTADRSVVTFVSDPPLTDSNILALLTLGRTGEELKGKEADVGVGEATSFMTGKFQDILESRARTLTGLDRFQVDPYISKTDVSVPRVTVGKEVVQDKVYMTYSSNVGATTPEQLFRIEYILNRNMSLVGERNETGNIGADLKFRFEFR